MDTAREHQTERMSQHAKKQSSLPASLAKRLFSHHVHVPFSFPCFLPTVLIVLDNFAVVVKDHRLHRAFLQLKFSLIG
jgi:hypothetical protein